MSQRDRSPRPARRSSRLAANACLILLAAIGVACRGETPADESPPAANPSTTPPAAAESPRADLVVEDLTVGTGPAIDEGTWAVVHSRIVGERGQVLENTRARNEPAEMFLPGGYIYGINDGLVGMQAGGERRLVIPPHLGFDDNPPSGVDVQPGETLEATIECLQVQPGPNISLPSGLQIESDGQGDGPAARYGSWVACHVLMTAGRDSRVVFDSRGRGELIEIGLPAPPGINVGRRLDPEIPWFGPALYGIRAGEFRRVRVPADRAFGGRGEMLLGVNPGEAIAYEVTCTSVQDGPVVECENGLRIENLEVGDGRVMFIGQYATFREELTLEDGTIVFSNLRETDPVSVSLVPRVGPAGWNRGVIGMRVGGVRRLTIPPALAYGDQSPRDVPIIPPNATLIFTVRLLDVQRQRPLPEPVEPSPQ